jgi:ubiquinol-cytochrome c reductase cytochrome c1 subunit
MTKFAFRLLPALLAGLFAATPALAAETAGLMHAGTDLGDQASLQRGAKLFVNNCSGCHSLQYMRYSRMAADLGLTEDEVMQNLNFTGGKIGDQMHVALTEDEGKQFFGKMPPDLSLIARVRGSDWIYTYLKSFYLDETRPLGWNNKLFPNASMPNPLWEQQGLQQPVYGEAEGGGDRPVEKLALATPGSQTPAQFDQSVRDITAFLEYVGEPAALKRQSMGVWVVLFLAFFTFLAWLLKKEFWKDVH